VGRENKRWNLRRVPVIKKQWLLLLVHWSHDGFVDWPSVLLLDRSCALLYYSDTTDSTPCCCAANRTSVAQARRRISRCCPAGRIFYWKKTLSIDHCLRFSLTNRSVMH
jgi:hypothetical protein